MRQRLRLAPSADARGAGERGWGPASIKKCASAAAWALQEFSSAYDADFVASTEETESTERADHRGVTDRTEYFWLYRSAILLQPTKCWPHITTSRIQISHSRRSR
jgi:hypothetical protein